MAEEAPPATKPEEPKKLEFTEEIPVITKHTAKIGGKELKYTVTTGRMPLKNGVGEIEAQVFYMAYALDDAEPEGRNLMFSFNGGPGSPSLWLH